MIIEVGITKDWAKAKLYDGETLIKNCAEYNTETKEAVLLCPQGNGSIIKQKVILPNSKIIWD